MAAEGSEWPEPLKDLLECTPERDTELQEAILSAGFDQGCFFRLTHQGQYITLTPFELLQFSGEMASREPGKHPEGLGDPFEDEPLAQGEIDGDDDGLAIVTQRCDLIKSVQKESLVEVAAAQLVDDPGLISQARSGTASHLILLCDTDKGAWIADLRAGGYISKLALSEVEVLQPVPVGRARRRVGLRIGARYSRDAVPASVSVQIRPLRDWLYKNATRSQLCDNFSEFMLHRQNEESDWELLVLIGDDRDEERATEIFEDKLIEPLGEKLNEYGVPVDVERSTAYTPERMPLALYQAAYKLDLDAVTYGSKSSGDQAEPAR